MASPSPYPPTNIYMQSLIKPVLMVSRMVENVSLDKNDASPAINHFSKKITSSHIKHILKIDDQVSFKKVL